MKVNADDIIKFAGSLKGKAIPTLSGTNAFTVDVTDKGLIYTPLSTEKPRIQSYPYIKRICDCFSETGSLRHKDYSFTAHATYALALIDRYVKEASVYDDMDPNIVSLVKAINEFPGIYTVSSCGGHRNNKPYQLPAGSWEVMFMLEAARVYSPSVDAWLSLEALAYAFSKCFNASPGEIRLSVYSPSPALNGPGESITFVLEGKDVDPEKVAAWLSEFSKDPY